MTVRLDMRRAAGRAARALGDSAEAVKDFLRGSLTEDGGFAGRDGRSDLYYTSFGLEASLVLEGDVFYDHIAAYLDGFGAGQSLDLVHLSCLVRCWANLADQVGQALDLPFRQAAADRLTRFRTGNGGYNIVLGANSGSVYGGAGRALRKHLTTLPMNSPRPRQGQMISLDIIRVFGTHAEP